MSLMQKFVPLLLEVLLLCSLSDGQAFSEGCKISLTSDVPNYSPVYLLSSDGVLPFELFKPTGEVTTLPIGAKLILTCTGASSNVITSLNLKSLELTCGNGNVFIAKDNSKQNLKNLECSSIPSSSLKLTSQPCSNNQGYIFEAGFDLPEKQFAPLFSMCYDNITEHTFYTHNILNGKAINFSVKESTRRAFSAAGMQLTTTATNSFYTINNQISVFKTLFGSNQPYVSKTSFLARGHMTPDADMIFAYEQLATYYYANAAPEFQVVNAGNWIRVENLARNLAGAYNDDLEIFNGIIGDLKLPHPSHSNILVPIVLDSNNKIKAPKYYFKVIRHVASDSALVMITLNNPFAKQIDVDEFCVNVCAEAGVADPFYGDLTRGYTFCCSLNEFKLNYSDLPSDLNATNLLINPSIK